MRQNPTAPSPEATVDGSFLDPAGNGRHSGTGSAAICALASALGNALDTYVGATDRFVVLETSDASLDISPVFDVVAGTIIFRLNHHRTLSDRDGRPVVATRTATTFAETVATVRQCLNPARCRRPELGRAIHVPSDPVRHTLAHASAAMRDDPTKATGSSA